MKIHPNEPLFVEFVPAYQVVIREYARLLIIDKKSEDTVPALVSINVQGEDADVPVIVNTRPASPAAVHWLTRCVVVPMLIVVAPVAL